MLGIVATSAAPSMAAVTLYGSAQLKYTVNATASLSLSTNFTTTGAQAAAAATILSNPAGNCSAGVAEASATLTFGGITPPSGAGMTGCYYKNAIGIGVLSNDALGVKVFEYTDAIAPGTAICAMTPTGAALAATLTLSPVAAAPAPATSATTCGAAPAGFTATALTGQGAVTPGSGFGAAGIGNGGTDVTATPTATQAGNVGFNWFSGTGNNGATWTFLGEDLQFNVAGTAGSGANTNVITVALIPN
jgi:hypothetical protein